MHKNVQLIHLLFCSLYSGFCYLWYKVNFILHFLGLTNKLHYSWAFMQIYLATGMYFNFNLPTEPTPDSEIEDRIPLDFGTIIIPLFGFGFSFCFLPFPPPLIRAHSRCSLVFNPPFPTHPGFPALHFQPKINHNHYIFCECPLLGTTSCTILPAFC